MDSRTYLQYEQPKSHRRWFPIPFFFTLVFLVAGSIPALLNIQGLQARFTGQQTTALATAVGENCGKNGNGNYYMYTFTDRSGKTEQIINNTVCSSGIVSDGEKVTIWYNPQDPSQLITADDLTFDIVFFVLFSLPLLIYLVSMVIALLRQLFRNDTSY